MPYRHNDESLYRWHNGFPYYRSKLVTCQRSVFEWHLFLYFFKTNSINRVILVIRYLYAYIILSEIKKKKVVLRADKHSTGGGNSVGDDVSRACSSGNGDL